VPAQPFHEGENLRLSAAQFLAFWSAVEALGAAPDLGLNLADQVPPDQFDVASSPHCTVPRSAKRLIGWCATSA